MTIPFPMDNDPMADVMASMLSELQQPTAKPTPNEQVEPNTPQDGYDETAAERRRSMLKAMYGEDFPLADEDTSVHTDRTAWARWARNLWMSRRAAMSQHLHLVQRNRMFRSGHQWVSARRGRPWTEKPAPTEAVRAVVNLIAPALDQRLQILTDQRPGFSVNPSTQDPHDKRVAMARQLACEFQFDQMRMHERAREAEYWAQTDGVAFWHLFWNPDIGPWDERLSEDGMTKVPMGDCDVRILRCEQVRVSPEATSTVPPSWVIIREVISKVEAAARHGYIGLMGVDSNNTTATPPSATYNADLAEAGDEWVLAQTVPGEGDRLRGMETAERFTVYLAPQPDILPDGLECIVVGNELVYGPVDLKFRCIPLVRVPDGSSDPSYFPRPTCEQWIDAQVRVNALVSKWVENVRVNSGGRFFARPNTMVTETFIGGMTSMIEVSGVGELGTSIQPWQGFSVGNDVKELLALEIKMIEDMTGWNAVSRGQVTGESGRAIIASREQLERVFAPPVQAVARAFTDWCKVVIAMMQWGYDLPRSLGAVGKGRPDLARGITSTDLDGTVDVHVEPATMMPMPLSYRMYQLDQWLQMGVIDLKEYRRRQAFAMARDISSPDEDQEARAKRVADAIVQGVPEERLPPIRWQDNEAIHQDVLERDIILQDDLPERTIAIAEARWMALAEQASQKQMQMAPPMQGGPEFTGQASGASPNSGALPPASRPLSSSNAPGASPPLMDLVMGGGTDPESLARQFDFVSPS